MDSELKSTLYYFYKYSYKTVMIFWLVYFGFIALFMTLALTTQGTVEFQGVNTLPSTIFMIIFGMLCIKDVFPFVIKFGVSRQKFTLATLVYALMLSTFMLVANHGFFIVTDNLIDVLNINNFNFVSFNADQYAPLINGNEYLFEWLMYLTFFLFFSLISALFYRLGMKWGLVVLSILPLSMLIQPVGTQILEYLSYLSLFHANYQPIYFLIPISLIVALLGLVIQKMSVIDQVSYKG
ncbi:ABC-2 type transport system permease protein [Pelagirhabdus alkalitolerans]|uniref:ABC-2 type transport system permease protein n=1 Tax=Pelagirhabdus alkalitolerans TaxID=1612202 RepID=A0A1G6HI21_9BACI|nr:hypothetical protein [Pelagirhabdus alkalitolerans]SDB93783.1 ABC-2 type transport system permease protein [Pelagirhabdus alkalitolerans]